MLSVAKEFENNNHRCLYCHHDTVESSWGEAMRVVKTYKCKNCEESFDIGVILGDPIDSFSFTCCGIDVHHNFGHPTFGLKKIAPDDWKFNLIWIPEFVVDFSNKDSLYKKLVTYLTFS